MCGRFTITRRDGNSLAAELGVGTDSFVDYKPRYNVAPTQDHFIVRIKFENRELLPARWGLVNSWAKDASGAARCINARAETADRVREDGGLLLMAGLYESWQMSPGQWQRTFTILTTSANSVTATYHDRMPVILDDRDADDWMDPRAPKPLALKKLLVPARDDLLGATPVSPKVNNVDNDSADLLETPKDYSPAARQMNLL